MERRSWIWRNWWDEEELPAVKKNTNLPWIWNNGNSCASVWEETLFLYCSLPPGGVWDAPAGDALESPVSSIFICGLWCLYACLCLLISLVCVCVYSPSCLIFPHSLSAFIIMKLPKQLQPSQQAVRDSCSSTHALWFDHTHVLLCSASLQFSCIYLMWNWAEQWHDVKAVVWWARWRVESSPRWPLSAGGGGGVSRGFDGVMDWCHSGQTCSAEVMISSRWWKRRNSNLFFFWWWREGVLLLLLISGIESWRRHFVVLITATTTFGHLICQLNSW